MATTPMAGRTFLVVGLAMGMSLAGAGGHRARAGDVDYLRDVKPILTRRCVACHGILTHRAGLRLDTAAGVVKGGDSGPAVVAGNLEESPLIDAVTGTDGARMPPAGEGEPVPASDVATLKAWVAAGAPRPGHEPEADDPRAHWAFRPPVRPAVPKVRNAAWVRNPVDAFLAARHESRGLTALGPADRGTLLRRVYLNLTGLAPSPQERQAFLNDPTPDAYEKVVDRLLSSPRYGERWGRHWMDIWRYSDWDGFGAEVRESQPHIWRWRDWIVESLNTDKGYDHMVVAMLAADEAAPGEESAARATGYLVRSWYKFNRNVWLDNIIEHTSKAFLGITLNCARCHDHKYDPIAQREYYRFRALFEPHEIRTDRLPGQPDTTKSGLVRVFDAQPEAPTFVFVRGDEKDPDKAHPLKPGLPAILSGKAAFEIKTVPLPLEASRPGLRRFVAEEELARAKAKVTVREAELAKAAEGSPAYAQADSALAAARAGLTATGGRIAAERARAAMPPSPDADLLARLAAAAERRAALLAAENTFVNVEAALLAAQTALKAKPADANLKKAVDAAVAQQSAAAKSRDAARVALAKDDAAYTPLGLVYPATSTGRRLALARWIVSRQNPTAARVAVNHVWMRHFGVPLVPTVTDFGLNGKPPTHPELLDWLAVELMDRGWSLKALHRLIVTSNAYRMRSTPDDSPGSPSLALDPSNRDLWRMNPRRMEAEAVRDNVLAASGRLLDTMGGPDLDPETGLTEGRRSLYFRHTKEKRVTFLRLFDSASVTSCYRRGESVVPQQALALANSSLVRDQARVLAGRLSGECASMKDHDTAFIAAAFARILGREPTGEERAECARYLREQPKRDRAFENFVHVLFNHNDFVTIR